MNKPIEFKRYDLINHFIRKFNYKTYLEIGISEPHLCFDKIEAQDKTGVDPAHWIPSFNRQNLINKTSDDFFKANEKYFDIIFIDGLHLEEQVTKDIKNSLDKLNPGGTIVLHDCNPTEEIHQVEIHEPQKCGAWMGTTWRAFAKFIKNNPSYNTYTINTDCGLGVIQKISTFEFEEENLNYEFLEKNRGKVLNLISIENFINYQKA